MFPVLGLFKPQPCLHCIADLCTRPNCFFSHKKLDIQGAKAKLEEELKQNDQSSEKLSPSGCPTNDASPDTPKSGIKNEANTDFHTNSNEMPMNSSKRFDRSSTKTTATKHSNDSAAIKTLPLTSQERHDRLDSARTDSQKKGEVTNDYDSCSKARDISHKHGSPSLTTPESPQRRLSASKEGDPLTTGQSSSRKKRERSPIKSDKNPSLKHKELPKKFKLENNATSEVRGHKSKSDVRLHGTERSKNGESNSTHHQKSTHETEQHHQRKLKNTTDKKRGEQSKLKRKSCELDSMDANGANGVTTKPSSSRAESMSTESEFSEDFLYPGNNNELEDDPDQIAFECLQMFNNYKPISPKEQPREECSTDKADNPKRSEIVGKKRVAHEGAAEQPLPLKISPTKRNVTPAAIMLQRYEKLNQTATTKAESKTSGLPDNSQVVGGKRRIAHVANVTGLLKPTISLGTARKSDETSAASKTKSQSAGNGEIRGTHKPKDLPPSFEPPKITLQSLKLSKVPPLIRQKVLDQIFQECRKIYIEPQDAAERALAEEKELCSRCSSKAVYVCAGTNTIARLRKEVTQGLDNNPSGSSTTGVQSHLSVLAGSSGAKTSWSFESAKRMIWPPSPLLLYIGISRYILTEDELVENSYPRLNPLGGGRAIAKPRPKANGVADLNTNSLQRTCERCMKLYKVNEQGFPAIIERCTYHYGRKFKRRMNGLIEGRYTCCDGDVSSEGCCVSDYHVSSYSSGELRGFVTAVKEAGEEEKMGVDPWDIVALDCEMIYTTSGNELARATFIGSNLKVLYDVHVKPIHPVLDYNTRFSGITEETLKNTTTTLTDVQAVLLANLKPNSILIGHSLESDLMALKLIHSCVVDTSVLFPHRLGPPFKRALRNLASDCVGKIIQMGEEGHDSSEDARSALEIVLWKLKEDNKLQDVFAKS